MKFCGIDHGTSTFVHVGKYPIHGSYGYATLGLGPICARNVEIQRVFQGGPVQNSKWSYELWAPINGLINGFPLDDYPTYRDYNPAYRGYNPIFTNGTQGPTLQQLVVRYGLGLETHCNHKSDESHAIAGRSKKNTKQQ